MHIAHAIRLVPQIFCHSACDCRVPSRLKPLLFHHAGCGGALLTPWSVCGQLPPNTGSTEVGFFTLSFLLQTNNHTHRHKHLNTSPQVDMHACYIWEAKKFGSAVTS